MTIERAKSILQTLIDGVDPITGEILPDDHVCNQPEVLQALHIAITSLPNNQSTSNPPMINRNGKLNAGRPWAKEDQNALIRLYRAGVSIDTICQQLQRRKRGVLNQLALLRQADQKADNTAPKHAGLVWTRNDEEFLCEMYGQKRAIREMADALQRTEYAVYCRMEKLGLCGDEFGYPQNDPQIWQDQQTEELRQMYLNNTSIAELAAHFGRSENAIAARLFQMGLIKKLPFSLLPRK